MTVTVHGFWAMLAAWWKEKKIFHAYWTNGAHYFRLFVPAAFHDATHRLGDSIVAEPSPLLSALSRNRDALLLFLHETAWHGALHHAEHTASGLGAADMPTRDRTTDNAEVNEAIAAIYATWDVVVFNGF